MRATFLEISGGYFVRSVSVSNWPTAIAQSLMLKRDHSIESVLIMFSTAARAAPEWTMPGIPLWGESVMLTTFPRSWGMKALVATAWVMCQVPWTFSSITVRKPFERDRLGRAQELPAGVVDEHVDAAVALEHAVDELADRLLVADVGDDRLGRAAALGDLGHHPLDRLRTASAADHRRPERGELAGARPAQPGPGARDQADLPVEQALGENFRSKRLLHRSRSLSLG